MKSHRYRAHNLLLSLGLVLISLLLALLAAEWFVREWLPVHNTVYALDTQRLHRFQANAWKIYIHNAENGGARVPVKINSHGYRGAEFSDEPGTGMARIVVYGDSFIAAEYSTLDETYVQQLGRALAAAGHPAELVNAGVTAYGPGQTSLYMQQGLGGLRADLVIVSIYAGNDFGDLMRNKLFSLATDGSLRTNQWQIGASLRQRFTEANALFDDSGLLNHSMLVRAAKKLYWAWRNQGGQNQTGETHYVDGALSARQREYRQFVEEGDNEVRNLFGDGYDADLSLAPDSPSARYKTRLMEQVMLRMRDIAHAANVPLLFLFVPSPIDACEHYEHRIDADDHPDYQRSALTDQLEVVAQRHALPYINLFEHFHVGECNALFYHAGNDHWTSRGQALAADITADYLRAGGLLPSQP